MHIYTSQYDKAFSRLLDRVGPVEHMSEQEFEMILRAFKNTWEARFAETVDLWVSRMPDWFWAPARLRREMRRRWRSRIQIIGKPPVDPVALMAFEHGISRANGGAFNVVRPGFKKPVLWFRYEPNRFARWWQIAVHTYAVMIEGA